MSRQSRIVSVFGSSQAEPGSAVYEEARQVGRRLATAGLTVCSGGYAGLMEAVSRGAKEAGGSTIGVTTDRFANLAANSWVDEEVRTTTFIERLETIIEIAQGYLALKGGIGTLTEISTVWSLLQTHSIPLRPFVLLVEPWQSLLDFCRGQLIIRDSDYGFLRLARTFDEAVHVLIKDMGAQA